jgi:hypothetical protein
MAQPTPAAPTDEIAWRDAYTRRRQGVRRTASRSARASRSCSAMHPRIGRGGHRAPAPVREPVRLIPARSPAADPALLACRMAACHSPGDPRGVSLEQRLGGPPVRGRRSSEQRAIADDLRDPAAQLGAAIAEPTFDEWPLFALAGPGSGRWVDDGLKARRASPLGKGSGPVAELVCQSCGMVSHSPLPRFRADTMPACLCGGRRQVVRVKHHLQAGERSGG